MPKKSRRRRHVPQRTCVGCREVHTKRSLVRIVRSPEGVFVDPSGKMSGRGAYLHERQGCWEKGLQGALAKALKTDLSAEDKERLTDFLAALSEEASAH